MSVSDCCFGLSVFCASPGIAIVGATTDSRVLATLPLPTGTTTAVAFTICRLTSRIMYRGRS